MSPAGVFLVGLCIDVLCGKGEGSWFADDRRRNLGALTGKRERAQIRFDTADEPRGEIQAPRFEPLEVVPGPEKTFRHLLATRPIEGEAVETGFELGDQLFL